MKSSAKGAGINIKRPFIEIAQWYIMESLKPMENQPSHFFRRKSEFSQAHESFLK